MTAAQKLDDGSQERLIAFVTNPETIKKAVEGSMEKRQKVLDDGETTFTNKLWNLLRRDDPYAQVNASPTVQFEKIQALFDAELERKVVEARQDAAIDEAQAIVDGLIRHECFYSDVKAVIRDRIAVHKSQLRADRGDS